MTSLLALASPSSKTEEYLLCQVLQELLVIVLTPPPDLLPELKSTSCA
jgi:hypothetical protein